MVCSALTDTFGRTSFAAVLAGDAAGAARGDSATAVAAAGAAGGGTTAGGGAAGGTAATGGSLRNGEGDVVAAESRDSSR